jgi:hypothetical protein
MMHCTKEHMMANGRDRQQTAATTAAMLRSGTRFGEMSMAASTVIARRVALSMAGDHSEMAVMVPEKVAAFTEASTAVMTHSAAMGGVLGRYALDEAAAGAQTAMRFAQCRDPGSLMMAQGQSMSEAWGRWMSLVVRLGADAVAGSDAAMRPVHRATSRNAKRLG